MPVLVIASRADPSRIPVEQGSFFWSAPARRRFVALRLVAEVGSCLTRFPKRRQTPPKKRSDEPLASKAVMSRGTPKERA